MKVVFFGTPRFAAEVLSYLLENHVDVVAVVTKPDRAQGRSATPIPTPVKINAQTHVPPIPVLQPEFVSAPENTEVLAQFQADLFVVVAYGELLKQHLLDMPKVACINLHASLLPKYRGAAPIQRCIINGEAETGVTIMHMVKKMDAGDMIATSKITIGPNTTYGELEEELCCVGSKLLLQAIHQFEEGTAQRTPQDHAQATIASKIELEDCQIDWDQSAQSIHNLVRGVHPHPGAWCYVTIKGQKKRLRVISTTVASEDSHQPAGKIFSCSKKGSLVSCGQGVIRLHQVQLEGKKVMSAEELMRGVCIETLNSE